ncbi:MAG: HAMP domain-containing histidine kinase [Magnetococcus sp. MYC-9]
MQLDLDELTAVLTRFVAHPGPDQPAQIQALLHTRLPDELRYIRASTQKMDRLINAILNLSRLGRKVLQWEVLDLQTLVEENVKALGHGIQSAGISVTVGQLPNLRTDRTAMEQIVGNLLSNAIKFLDPNRPGLIHIDGEMNWEAGQVVIRVRDNGRGIDPADIQKIFVLFQRAGKQDRPGEGMGLAYIRSWVRRLGGRIRCESTVGVGTTFCVTLPITPPAH